MTDWHPWAYWTTDQLPLSHPCALGARIHAHTHTLKGKQTPCSEALCTSSSAEEFAIKIFRQALKALKHYQNNFLDG